ncbi:hypothetical protein OG818_03930 [Streptomyces virginiae]|uniref:hypothetical protein n=1 Tax=Streptomyces virginiae TaxID=1961 RepID=UPI002256FD0B|nr:hypothetical protein [Streptomyces virginiae]MCX4714945.1 hypothetical protein [Streptomyces virginiae]
MLADDDYLLRIGRLSYLVTYLEWQVLGDLPHIPGLPAELEVRKLVGMTTGHLARTFQSAQILQQVADPAAQNWLRRSGELLESAARDRNSVLHARPATIAGRQILNRWHPDKNEVFVVDESWLDAAEQRLRDAVREVSASRVARIQ